ncbi:MAG: CpsD/CapB family tyrosine-protein kinase [Candidatus Acidiferrum sp.]
MSKNFELLQQIGNEEELFQTALQTEEEVLPESAGQNPEIPNTHQGKFWRNASLPDVFHPVGVPSCSTPSDSSDLNSGIYEESGTEAGEPAKQDPVLNQPAAADPAASPSAASGDSLHKKGNETPQFVLGRFSSSSPWMQGVKTAAKRWSSKLQSRDNRPGADLATIAREEEIKLVQRIFPGTVQDSPRVGLFASVDELAGCAAICARTGEILAARAEGPVCLVDANFQSPSLHKCFGLENDKGLAEATLETGPVQNFAQQISGSDLWLMTSGKLTAEVSSPTAADALRGRLSELRKAFRYVVIHSGPLRLESTAMLLSRLADGVVLVLEANSTRRDSARRAKENLAAARVTLLGVVLNNRIFPIPEPIYRWL